MTDRFAAMRVALGALGTDGWIVGGGLRDALLGAPPADVDVAVPGDAETVARRLARAQGATRFTLSDAFGAWRVTGGDLPFTVDITPLQGDDIVEDLSRRDFTINAMAIPLGDGPLIDPNGGRADLEGRVLRMVSPQSFRDDPVRIVRCARIACQTGFAIDDATRLRARMDAGALTQSAGERIFEELRRIARLADAWRALELLDDVGGLGVLVPELEEGRGLEQTPYHHKDVLGHTLEVVQHACAIRADPDEVFRGAGPGMGAMLAEPLADQLTRGEALVFACLFHDMAKPATYALTSEGRATFFRHDIVGADMAADWCRRSKTSNRLRETVSLCVRRHLALGFMVHRQPLSLRQIVRYLDLTAPADAELLVLSCADRLATNGRRTTPPQIARHLDVARQVARELVRMHAEGSPTPLLNGLELVELAARPAGPWTARAVAALREEQLVGLVRTRAQAERFIHGWIARELHAAGDIG